MVRCALARYHACNRESFVDFLSAGVNMGYMDNSYSNSNNGGSVNSQDSIWQMKSAAANGVSQPYDLTGYGTTESDYPTHPHYLPQREDYRESHNLSRQQFCTEPFATVVKSQKHVGQCISLTIVSRDSSVQSSLAF